MWSENDHLVIQNPTFKVYCQNEKTSNLEFKVPPWVQETHGWKWDITHYHHIYVAIDVWWCQRWSAAVTVVVKVFEPKKKIKGGVWMLALNQMNTTTVASLFHSIFQPLSPSLQLYQSRSLCFSRLFPFRPQIPNKHTHFTWQNMWAYNCTKGLRWIMVRWMGLKKSQPKIDLVDPSLWNFEFP